MMKEWVLVIAVLTSSGWMENEVDYHHTEIMHYRPVVQENIEYQYCKQLADRIANPFHRDGLGFIKAYCREALNK